MSAIKQYIKRNSHNSFFSALASAGKPFQKLYENRNHDIVTNGEEWLIMKISKLHPKIIFDVGANTGKYCNLVKQHCPESHIYCFEPVSTTFEELKNTTRHMAGLTLVQSGLFNENRYTTINLYPSHTHASVFSLKAVPYEKKGEETIQVFRGDDFMESNGVSEIDLLKLDIEGAELDALKGFSKSFAKRKIRLVQFEYGYINITTKNLLIDYYDFFDAHGYAVGKLYPKSVKFRPYKFAYEDFGWANMVVVHRDDEYLKNLIS